MIIDFHTHVFPPKIKENRSRYIEADPAFALLYSDKGTEMVTSEELVNSMDEEGVDLSVIVNIGWTTHELCVETNDYIMESVARYPDRLVGFGSIQPNRGDAAIAELKRCAKGGLKGIGELRPDLQMFDLRDEAITPIAEELIRQGLILLTHASEPVGHNYAGKGTVTPDTLYPFIASFPDLTMVCAHWGGGLPFYALMPEVKQALGNVYFDTAASPYLYHPQVYNQVIQLVGGDKILFGTDYPLLRPSRLLEEINFLNLPAETRELILSGNARRVLGIDKER